MGVLLVALSFVAFAVCLIALIIPFKPLPFLKTRAEAGIGMAVSIIVFVVGVLITPTADVGAAETVAASEVTSSSASSDASSHVAEAAQVKVNESRAFIKELHKAAARCDMFGTRIAAAADAGDLVAIYEASNTGEGACYTAARTMRGVKPPASLSKETRKSLDESADKLGEAYMTKGYGMAQFRKIADGDMRASVLSEAKQSGERAQALSMVAFAEIFAALTAEGVDTEKVMAD